MNELNGKVALITGAATGIGRATAALFAREGASLVLADLNAEQGEALAGELRAQFYVAQDAGYASLEEVGTLRDTCAKCSSQISRLMDYLKRSNAKPAAQIGAKRLGREGHPR